MNKVILLSFHFTGLLESGKTIAALRAVSQLVDENKAIARFTCKRAHYPWPNSDVGANLGTWNGRMLSVHGSWVVRSRC